MYVLAHQLCKTLWYSATIHLFDEKYETKGMRTTMVYVIIDKGRS